MRNDIDKIVEDYRVKISKRTFENSDLSQTAPELLRTLITPIGSEYARIQEIELMLELIQEIKSSRTKVKTVANKKEYITEILKEKDQQNNIANILQPDPTQTSLSNTNQKDARKFLSTKGWSKWIENILKAIGLIGKTDLDQVLDEATKFLEKEKNALIEQTIGTRAAPVYIENQTILFVNRAQYTPEDIAISGQFTPESFRTDDSTGVYRDFSRASKLGDLVTFEKSEGEIRLKIDEFTDGRPEVNDFISKTPSQAMASALEKELMASFAQPAGFINLTKTSAIAWKKEGDRFFCDVDLAVSSVTTSDGKQHAYSEKSGQAKLVSLDGTEGQALTLGERGKDNTIKPVLTASMRVELVVGPDGTVTPKVERLDVTSYVPELKRVPTRNYSEDQLAAIDITDTVSTSRVHANEGGEISTEVTRDFISSNTAQLIIRGKAFNTESSTTKLAEGIKQLTRETNLSQGFSEVIAKTPPQSFAAIANKQLRDAIKLGQGESPALHPQNINWSMDRHGNLIYEATVTLIGAINSSTEIGTLVNPNTGELEPLSDTDYTQRKDSGKQKNHPIAVATMQIKYSKDANGVVQPPVLTSLTVQTNFPKAYPLVAPSANPRSAMQAGVESSPHAQHSVGPPWTAAQVQHHEQSANTQHRGATLIDSFNKNGFSRGNGGPQVEGADEDSDTGLSH